MKFLLTQLSILIICVAFTLHLFSLDYFLPIDARSELNWYGISTVLFLLFMIAQSLISLTVFLTQKFLAYGWKEFPDYRNALKWGLGLALSIVIALLLNAFHILTLQWGILAILLVIVAIAII